MTHFQIICTGWKNWPWIAETLASIDRQTYTDYEVCVVDDHSEMPELSAFITTTCEERGWYYVLNEEHRRAVYNQVHAIRLMDPDPEDVLVWLDPDGDMFAHENVLNSLVAAYADGTRLAYSKYECITESSGSNQSRRYPDWVIERNAYRQHDRENGITWNHLRTMKADLFLQMSDPDFQTDDGVWFNCSTDSAFMYPGLELARGRVKFIEEVLLLYRPDHELSDWKRYPAEIDRIHHVILTRPPK